MADDQKPRIIVKKKSGHGAHHGGAWKVAYADFVTAMMALFMVLWLLTQADLKLRQQIAQYFRSPGVLQGGTMLSTDANEAHSREPKVVSVDVTIVQGDAEEDFLRGKSQELHEAIERAAQEDPSLAAIKEQVLVEVTDAGLSIQVVDKNKLLLFDLSSAELKPSVVELLKRIAQVLGHMPNPIQIGGHTDARPYPQQAAMTNWELSFRRADAARRILELYGLRPGQMNRVLAFADTELIVPSNPMADENRRLSILAVRQGPPPPGAKGATATTGAMGTTGAKTEAVAPISLPPDPLPRF